MPPASGNASRSKRVRFRRHVYAVPPTSCRMRWARRYPKMCESIALSSCATRRGASEDINMRLREMKEGEGGPTEETPLDFVLVFSHCAEELDGPDVASGYSTKTVWPYSENRSAMVWPRPKDTAIPNESGFCHMHMS